MNKKIMALAVAGALAVPGVALAQVTISGGFRVAVQHMSFGNVQPGQLARFNAGGVAAHTSITQVVDNVTQIIFQAREDLGGGLTAIGRYEWRPLIDGAGAAANALPNGTGCATNFVGLESKTLGTLRVGCVATYSGAGGTGRGYTADRGLALTGSAGILELAYTGAALTNLSTSAATQVNFGQGRQGNAVTWNSPNWNGFDLALVWSSQNAGNDADLTVPPAGVTGNARKGNAYIIAPGYRSGPLSLKYMRFQNNVDGFAAVGAFGVVRDFKADKAYVTYDFSNGLSLTGVWSKVTQTNAYSGAGALLNAGGGNKISEQAKWLIGSKYATGPHTFALDYTRAENDKVLGGGTGAKQWAAGWMYEFSKRTEVGLSYTRITNDTFAAYGPQDTALNSLGSTNDAANAGETYTLWGVNMTHKF